MTKMIGGLMVFLMLSFFAQESVMSQTRERSDIDVKHTWNLADLYATDQDWEAAKKAWASKIITTPLGVGK